MRTTLIAGLLAVLTLTACTPAERAMWTDWHSRDPDAAAEFAIGMNRTHTTGRCAEWHDHAIDAGFTEGQWPNVARIMYRESRCQPGAYNPSGASGLMQIMPMWADDCGLGRAQLLEAWPNLRCAVHILHVQGWSAWATTF